MLDPDDIDIPAGRDERLPDLAAEWEALSDKLHAMQPQTDGTGGETVRLVLDLPKEWAILAAWLELQSRMRAKGEARPLGRDINLNPKLADWRKAKAYLWRELNNHFHDELHCLCVGAHPYLYPVLPIEPRSSTLDLDDDLQF